MVHAMIVTTHGDALGRLTQQRSILPAFNAELDVGNEFDNPRILLFEVMQIHCTKCLSRPQTAQPEQGITR
jgi:hypothetical protein